MRALLRMPLSVCSHSHAPKRGGRMAAVECSKALGQEEMQHESQGKRHDFVM